MNCQLVSSTNPGSIAQIVDTATGHQTLPADEVPTITSAAFVVATGVGL